MSASALGVAMLGVGGLGATSASGQERTAQAPYAGPRTAALVAERHPPTSGGRGSILVPPARDIDSDYAPAPAPAGGTPSLSSRTTGAPATPPTTGAPGTPRTTGPGADQTTYAPGPPVSARTASRTTGIPGTPVAPRRASRTTGTPGTPMPLHASPRIDSAQTSPRWSATSSTAPTASQTIGRPGYPAATPGTTSAPRLSRQMSSGIGTAPSSTTAGRVAGLTSAARVAASELAGVGRLSVAVGSGSVAAGTPPAAAVASGGSSVASGAVAGSSGTPRHSTIRARRRLRAKRRGQSPVNTAVRTIVHEISQIERHAVVPRAFWVGLGLALAIAILALLAAFRFGRRAGAAKARVDAATTAAMTDELTGMLNRRGFAQAMERELARARRYARPFAIAYADVRGLKSVNDSQGHLAGDELLQGVATLLRASARSHDIVGRLGGDEFALLLPEQGPQDADTVSKRIRDHVGGTRAALGFSSRWDLTIGTAAYPRDGDTADELIAVADRRLYEQRGIALAGPR